MNNLWSNWCFPADRLLFVINAIKEEIVERVEDSSPRPTNMSDTLERLIKETLGENRKETQVKPVLCFLGFYHFILVLKLFLYTCRCSAYSQSPKSMSTGVFIFSVPQLLETTRES